MKAVERRRLKQNSLAERINDMMSKIRKPPGRRTWLWLLLVVLVGVGLFIFFRSRRLDAIETSRRWVVFDEALGEKFEDLAKKANSTTVGKAVLFQQAWKFAWDGGIKRIATDQTGALENLKGAKSIYRELQKLSDGDPIYEPEARYNLALIEETYAVVPLDAEKHLETARDMYRELAKKYPESAHGKFAAKRAEELESGSDSYREILTFYRNFQQDAELGKQQAEKARQKMQKFRQIQEMLRQRGIQGKNFGPQFP